MAGLHTEIVFTGDISFSKYFDGGWKNDNLLASEVMGFLGEADHVVANVECALTTCGYEKNKLLNHASNPEAGRFLSKLGIKIWSLANNHIMDCGVQGLNDTLRCAKENHCQTLGVGENFEQAAMPVIVGDHVKIGIFSIANPWDYLKTDKNACVLTWDKKDRIKNAVTMIRSDVDWIVFVVHGGDEYSDIALPYMRERYKALLDLGADIIVAHHPHVVQNYERVGEKYIFYSLGNFIFDTENQRDFAHTDAGILLGVDFKKDSFSFNHLPIRINRTKGTVEKGDTPAVFCELNEKDYAAIWPYAARYFYPADLKKRKKKSKRLASASKPLLFAHEVYMCRRKRELTIQLGRILSVFGGWKKSESKDVRKYIAEGI